MSNIYICNFISNDELIKHELCAQSITIFITQHNIGH